VQRQSRWLPQSGIGANIQGLGGALFEAIEFERAASPIRISPVIESSFPRTSPKSKLSLSIAKDIAPAGAGETPIMAVAPAIGNAIFNATKQRLNNLR